LTEDINQMRKRHEQEITDLRASCKHKILSPCMPYAWAPGHISHCVKVCNHCGKITHSTREEIGSSEIHFDCEKRKDCFHYESIQKLIKSHPYKSGERGCMTKEDKS